MSAPEPSGRGGTDAAPSTPRSPFAPSVSTALLTDRYELTMLQAALADGSAHRHSVFEVFARRLQIQERMTAQIADTIQEVLKPRGVAVVIEAAHDCMRIRGVNKPGSTMTTSRLTGVFRDTPSIRREFLALIGRAGA